ncbi:hypothetical protein [Aliiglaciecola sp. LCG003]|uniref:DUF7010 family protein n=1 Tax=Aliiglaciecola sp. LCG003 TaxID=3053655 RepID=UPI002573A842|nr:hypothetical protein [Aliiglaciecola sp. LCG003]WJG09349.1 hypothetical protein QR722_18780 [Aliiglaciecola sp. LCG003]
MAKQGVMMNFNQAQGNMNFAYFGGSMGVFASGIIWGIAGLVALLSSNQASMYTLFFAGMLIHPIAILLSKALKRPGAHLPDNPLGKLALESTIILFVGLFIAFYVAKLQVEWFYPIMLLIIGVRYLPFQTLYATKLYWFLGGLLMLCGVLCILFGAKFVVGAFIGSGIELLFSLIIFYQSRRQDSNTAL